MPALRIILDVELDPWVEWDEEARQDLKSELAASLVPWGKGLSTEFLWLEEK